MGNPISYLLHLGIVRVLSVPVAVVAIIVVLYMLAAPPADLDGEGG